MFTKDDGGVPIDRYVVQKMDTAKGRKERLYILKINLFSLNVDNLKSRNVDFFGSIASLVDISKWILFHQNSGMFQYIRFSSIFTLKLSFLLY